MSTPIEKSDKLRVGHLVYARYKTINDDLYSMTSDKRKDRSKWKNGYWHDLGWELGYLEQLIDKANKE